MAVTQVNAYQEIVDFMASRPTVEAMADFRFSDEIEAHINELLATNRTRRLTDAEAAELDEFDKLEHMMRMVKLKALEKLSSSS